MDSNTTKTCSTKNSLEVVAQNGFKFMAALVMEISRQSLAISEHHQNKDAAVNDLSHVGGDGVRHPDKAWRFR